MKRTASLIFVLLLIPATAHALDTQEMLSLVAMPLAVAAVSELTDVPPEPLFELVSLLNEARVPPSEFIEVVRYAPVALVVDAEPDFVDFVRLQTTQGATGVTLVRSIETELREYGLPNEIVIVEAPRVVEVDQSFVPVVVRNTVARNRAHPHGGPPGQLKKELGYQTGAEIVHDAARGRSDERQVAESRSRGASKRSTSAAKPEKRKSREERPQHVERGRSARPATEVVKPPGNSGKKEGKPPGAEKSKGKGKGKGKGR